MSTRTQKRLSYSSLLLLAVAFIVAVIISNKLFSGWRMDLTDNKLYTLSDGTKQILGRIDTPIAIRFYVTDDPGVMSPAERNFAGRMDDFLSRCQRVVVLSVKERHRQHAAFFEWLEEQRSEAFLRVVSSFVSFVLLDLVADHWCLRHLAFHLN